STFTWTVDGGGAINSVGVFSATTVGQRFVVRAVKDGKSGSAIADVVSFDVSQAYAFPVPFKSSQASAITFDRLGSQSKIRIYTISGRLVVSLSTDQNRLDWDLKNSSGEKVASGVYYFVIESPEGKKNGKLIIIQ